MADDYLVEVGLIEEDKNAAKILTLNRPHKLNCLSIPMVRRLCELFENWEIDDSVKLIILKGTGRAFCAGGDLRMFYRHGKEDDGLCREIVYRKYWLDFHLHSYKKPIVALLHSLVMGGGAGLTVPSKFRIVTEKTIFSMPEASIGYHTDVGASYFLSHLPGYFGDYLAVTGARIDGAEMICCGLATHFVHSEKLQALEESLLNVDNLDEASILEAIETFATTVKIGEKSALHSLDIINNIFSKESVEDILEALIAESAKNSSDWIKESIKILKRSSPTGVKMTFRSVREGRNQSIADTMRREFRLTMNTLSCVASNDLYEGIRAIVVDKDNAPKWSPVSYVDVTQEKLDLVFKHLENPADELQLPDGETIPRWGGKYCA